MVLGATAGAEVQPAATGAAASPFIACGTITDGMAKLLLLIGAAAVAAGTAAVEAAASIITSIMCARGSITRTVVSCTYFGMMKVDSTMRMPTEALTATIQVTAVIGYTCSHPLFSSSDKEKSW